MPLGQNNDLTKLFIGQANERLRLCCDAAVLWVFKQRDELAVAFLPALVFIPGVFALVLQGASEFIPCPCAGKKKLNQGNICLLRLFAAHDGQTLSAGTAAGLVVQGVADRVQNGGLACPGCSADQKQPVGFQLCKVEKLLVHVWAKALKTNGDRFHPRSSSSSLQASTS